MDLIWTNADDGTETRMELSTLEHKLAFVRVDIIVELVKVGKSCEPWSGNVSDTREEETMYYESKEVNSAGNACEAKQRRRCHRGDHGCSTAIPANA